MTNQEIIDNLVAEHNIRIAGIPPERIKATYPKFTRTSPTMVQAEMWTEYWDFKEKDGE